MTDEERPPSGLTEEEKLNVNALWDLVARSYYEVCDRLGDARLSDEWLQRHASLLRAGLETVSKFEVAGAPKAASVYANAGWSWFDQEVIDELDKELAGG